MTKPFGLMLEALDQLKENEVYYVQVVPLIIPLG